MDQHDLKASAMVNNVRHIYSPKEQDCLGVAKSLSDCCGTCTGGNTGFQKQEHGPDCEIRDCKASKLPDCNKENRDDLRASSVIPTARDSVLEKENCAEGTSAVMSCCDVLEAKGNLKQDEVSTHSPQGIASTKNISMKSDVSSDSGQALDKENNELVDGRMNGYWLSAGESGLKSAMQTAFHDKPYKTESSSSNSTHITLPASSNDSCQETSVDVKSFKHSKTSAMDISTCTDLKSKLKGPALQILALGTAAQAPKDVLDTADFQPGRQQNVVETSEIVENVRVRDSNKVLGMISDHNSVSVKNVDLLNPNLPMKKLGELSNQGKVEPCYELDALEVARRVAREVEREVGTYREASGSSSSVQEKNDEAVHLSSIDSVDSNKKECLTESASKIQLCNEQDNCDSFCSIEEVVNPEMSARNEGLRLEVKEPSLGMGRRMIHESVDGLRGLESSYVTTKPEVVAASNQTTHISRIDLNEDILANEVEYPEQFVNGTITYHVGNVLKPIPVLAKARIPICLPVSRLHREGELGGWRAFSAKSAFRPTSLSKSFNRNKSLSTKDNNDRSNDLQVKGIDLNIAAAGVDFDMDLLPDKCVPPQSSLASKEASVEVSSTRARRFHIDLNSASENDDNCHQLSLPASFSGHSVRDFDLNDNPASVDACIDAHYPGQVKQASRNRAVDDPAVSFMGFAKQQDSKSVGSGYWADFSSMQGFSHDHAKPLLVAAPNIPPSNEQMQRMAPLQQKLTYTPPPPPPPPHAFLYSNGFCIDPNNSLSSTVYSHSVLPYITDPHGTTVIPQFLGSGSLSAFSGAPHSHIIGIPGGPGPSDISIIRPSFDLNGTANSSENGSRGENARQLFIPISNSTLEEPMKSFQQAFSATPMKRREPDGGWDSHQHSCRQVTSWR